MSKTKRDLVGSQVARIIGVIGPTNTRARGDVATMARLRRADPADVGGDPLLWAVTFEGLAEELYGSDGDPSYAERAIYAGLILYAIHQQSSTVSVHTADVPFGCAVRDLAKAKSADDEPHAGVVTRFQSAALADSFRQRTYFLRQLMAMMRTLDRPLPFNHAGLAADLYAAQFPGGDQQVRLRWGRDFYRASTKTAHTEEHSIHEPKEGN